MGSRLSKKNKKEQKEAISAILNGDDVFAVLLTGFGKSYIYTFLLVETVPRLITVACRPMMGTNRGRAGTVRTPRGLTQKEA